MAADRNTVEDLYRAAVAADLDLPANAPLTRDVARTLHRLAGVLQTRSRARRVLLTLEFDGEDAPPRIREWGRTWNELD